MDIRAVIAGAVAIIALLGLIILTALGHGADVADRLDAIIASAMTFLLGLYSSPYEEPDEVVEVDEPAGVTRAEAGQSAVMVLFAAGWFLAVALIVAAFLAGIVQVIR